jgi:tRNA/tmRNA/rRNA uracil-C5-methylase (TrmA/RlmC/RlmD family)
LAPETEQRLRAFCEALGVVPEIRSGPPLGYRVRARLSVRASGQGPLVGIFEQGSHQLVDIPECTVHHPLVNRVASALRTSLAGTFTSAYQEGEHRGLVRALQVVVERASRSAQVTLVLNSARFLDARAVCAALSSELGSELHSLFLNAQPRRSNTILGHDWLHVSGPEATRELLGTAQVFYPPGAFGQANLGLFERIVSEVHQHVPPDGHVLEFHAGTGALGLGLVARSKTYAFNELGRDSLAGLELGLQALGQGHEVSVLRGSAARFAAQVAQADTVIVDPPRKGLEPELLAALCAPGPGPSTLVYLSCDLGSLIRDSEALCQRYRVASATGYALFPFTPHVETLLRFER